MWLDLQKASSNFHSDGLEYFGSVGLSDGSSMLSQISS